MNNYNKIFNKFLAQLTKPAKGKIMLLRNYKVIETFNENESNIEILKTRNIQDAINIIDKMYINNNFHNLGDWVIFDETFPNEFAEMIIEDNMGYFTVSIEREK